MTSAEPFSISNSEIQTFKNCKRKWYLAYWRRLRKSEERMTGPLALGSRVHLALENYYNEIETGGDLVVEWKKLVDEDRAILEMAGRDTTDFDNEADLGRIMLEGYVEWIAEEGIDSDYTIIGNEDMLSAPMLDGRVNLVGKIDQRVRRKADGAKLIRDYKTAASFAELQKTAPQNEQFLTYMLLEMLTLEKGERCDGALVTALKKVKRTASARPPFYLQMEVSHNIFALRNFWTRVNAELAEIADTRDALDQGADHHAVAYPRPTRDCSWSCEYSTVCPMFDDGSAVEPMIEELFITASPYGYYGKHNPENKSE